MSAEAGKYAIGQVALLPESIRTILGRLAKERGVAVHALIDQARREHADAGKPQLAEPPACVTEAFGPDELSLGVYKTLRWWLARSPQREALAARFGELAAWAREAAAGNLKKGAAALRELVAIANDPTHPAQAGASDVLSDLEADALDGDIAGVMRDAILSLRRGS